MTPEEAGKLLGKSRDSVIELIRAGELEAQDLRNAGAERPRYRISAAALAMWRESRRVPMKADAVSTVARVPQPRGVLARMRARKRAAEIAGG
jgi:excisionase family DNA binding protein